MIESRRGGDPDKSYVARLFAKGPDAVLKKPGRLDAADDRRTAILDEAQYIKNPYSQTAQAARALKADHRLAGGHTETIGRHRDRDREGRGTRG